MLGSKYLLHSLIYFYVYSSCFCKSLSKAI